MNQKTCSTCKRLLPVSEFHANPRKPDGLQYCCKSCKKAYNLKWESEHKPTTPSSSGSKTCSSCGSQKPVSEFHPDPRNHDGLKQKCKDCINSKARQHSRSDAVKIREKIKYQHRSEQQRLKQNEYARRYYHKNKPKHKARMILFKAVRSGKIPKLPCSVCGDTNSQAHHHDYSKPLDVIWLCQTHHAIIHRKYQ